MCIVIFRIILFIFTTARVFAWGFNFFSLCAVVFVKTYFTFLPSRASNCQIHSDYFFFTFICKVTWLIKFETRKCSDVNVFHCFNLACLNTPNSFGISLETKFPWPFGSGNFVSRLVIFRKYPSQSWYICSKYALFNTISFDR